ncbi:hypothetical protein HYPSUDRAFT_77809 [Hypholoma sublateritium FD-334 SS-4]|uniref:Cytochrome P450 n=1 Tax=Hypholoma sublateritium (strain FD-334 SS-4) TaxID=945553 RepID=A0A0D2NY17_HYPSF|nr:hypothetical protein HYPSUDRAFT_77809 [Hypholoma sublateritium FD-334 SS-4]
MSYADLAVFEQAVRDRITVQNIIISFTLVSITSVVVSYRRGLMAVSHFPGIRALFHPLSVPGAFIPTTWWNPGIYFAWNWRNAIYKCYENDTISFVPMLLGPPTFYTSNLEVARQLVSGTNSARSFHKPEAASKTILHWGMNLFVADGDLWRKHRRIVGPAFNSKLYEAVWAETLRTYREMVSEEGWEARYRIRVPVVQALTFKVALLIITKCGFGFSFSWADPVRTADGRMALQEAFRVISDASLTSALVPRWMQRFPLPRFKQIREAERELMGFMRAQVIERKGDITARGTGASSAAQGTNVFSMLVQASEDEESKFKLDDSELIGNVFIMLFAGHETTAHSLASTLGFLSVNNDIQEDIYEQIIAVVGRERDPVYDDYPKLDKVLATFLEALRMFPSGYVIVRQAFEDTILQVPNPRGREGSTTIPVPKGMTVAVDMIGLQYNPRYFDSPEEYRPSRWYGIANDSEAFTAFSIGAYLPLSSSSQPAADFGKPATGPRTCIGRKFTMIEAVCFLTLILRDYRVEPLLRATETLAQWKTRVLDAKIGLTLGVKDVPLTFIRRGKV